MDDRQNPAGEPAATPSRREGFAQRLPFIVAGMMIGMVLYFALFIALNPFLGGGPAQLVARGISLAAAFYIAIVYPRRSPRAALGLLALGTAAALIETLLIR
jgi:hypothetical protein